MFLEIPFFASQHEKTWSKRDTETMDQDLAFISLLYFKPSCSSGSLTQMMPTLRLGNVSCQNAQGSCSTASLF